MGQYRQLWGHDFPLVAEGLSEASVVDFVNKLMEERESLAKGQESLIYLRQLAEKMVVEAGQMATAIKQQAEAEASALMTVTQSRADEIDSEIAQIMSEATAKADDIVHKVQQEADLLKAQTRKEIEEGVEPIWARFCEQMGALASRAEQELRNELNGLCQSIRALRTKYQGNQIEDSRKEPMEKKLEPPKSFESVSIGSTKNVIAMPVNYEQPSTSTVLSPGAEVADRFQTTEAGLPTSVTGTPESPVTSQLEAYQGEVEIIIAPPMNAVKLIRIVRELEVNPRIHILNVVESEGGSYAISLSLEKPVALISLLKMIDGVKIHGTMSDGSQSGKTRKLKIELAS